MVEVRVPATSANIGPGFDCLGVAVNIYNKFFVEEIEEGIILKVARINLKMRTT